MSDALIQVENQVLSFSLAEQIRLLTFIANNVNKQTSMLAEGEALKKLENQVWKPFGKVSKHILLQIEQAIDYVLKE